MQGTHRVEIRIAIEQLDKNGNTVYGRGITVNFGRLIECKGIKDAVEILEKFEELSKTVGLNEQFENNVTIKG